MWSTACHEKWIKYCEQHNNWWGMSCGLLSALGFVRHRGASVTGREWPGIPLSTEFMLLALLQLLTDTQATGDLSYHLATDCGLQRIHQLCCDPDEIVVVRLDLIVPLQVRHGSPFSFYQLLVELLGHIWEDNIYSNKTTVQKPHKNTKQSYSSQGSIVSTFRIFCYHNELDIIHGYRFAAISPSV